MDFKPTGMQGQTYGLSSWPPLSGGCARQTDSYSFRSGLSAAMALGGDFKPERLRAMVEEARTSVPFFFGDYYPLTPYSIAETDWLAMQFHGPAPDQGVVLAFRRIACRNDSLRLKLHGLDAAARYRVKDLDQDRERWQWQ